MLRSLEIFFLLFVIYSVLGWFLEIISTAPVNKHFVNRGFLIGPYCPIYGFGALIITLFLGHYADAPFGLFIMAVFSSAILEYLSSYFMEKIFHARWWDYSHKKFNLNGRICADTLIPFGLLGLFITYISNRFFLNFFNSLSDTTLRLTAISCLIVLLVDFCVSVPILFSIRKTNLSVLQSKQSFLRDNTEEISKLVRAALKKRGLLWRRIVTAFPGLKISKP